MAILPSLSMILLMSALVVVLAGRIICYRLLLHPLAAFPGPKLWAASRLPWMRHTARGTLWRELQHLHRQYGSTVRIAPNELSICSPPAWPDIYITRPLLPKEPSSKTAPLNGAHSLFTAADDTHRRLRSILVAGFSDKALREQSPIIEHHVSEFIARLRRELSCDTVLDIQKLFGYAALDTTTDLSYGESMNGLAGRNEHDWIARFSFHGRFSSIRMCLYWFYPLDKILDFLVLSLTRRQRSRNWETFSAKIERRLAKGDMTGTRSDLITPVIGRMIEDVNVADPKTKTITKLELLSHSLSSVVANSQLTTMVLTTCIHLLLHNKRALNRLEEEIRAAFVSEDEIGVQSTQPLAYLEAVINEALRIRHPTPVNLPRVVLHNGRIINGTFVPGKTTVGINLHVIQTSPLFWVEPDAFYPERFLPSSDRRYDTRFDQDVKTAYMPFSAGPRNCIGGK